MLVKVDSKYTQAVVSALIEQRKSYHRTQVADLRPRQRDGGQSSFTLATDINVYFCDRRSPWQRGSNETAKGLLRQYFPKGINLSLYSQSKLNAIARRLNERLRKN